MRSLPLRTQLIAVVLFLQVYSLGVGAAYWNQSRAHERLARSFQHDLAVLSSLPRLRDELRQVDAFTDQYLVSGGAQWLEKRRAALEEVRAASRELSVLGAEGDEGDILARLDRQLAAYLSQQTQWISRKEAGRLPGPVSAGLIEQRKGFDEIVGLLTKMKNDNIEELDRRRRAVTTASRVNVAAILATGIAVGALLAFFLSRYMVGPIVTLRRYAREWKLGSDWSLSPAHASPEVRDLLSSMKVFATRLNQEYRKEQEIVELKSQLVSMVSHEFNNVLSTLKLLSALMKESEPAGDAKRRRYYEVFDSSVHTLKIASENLLNLGRQESGQLVIKPRGTDLEPMVREVLNGLDLLRPKTLEVKLEFPDKPLRVRADPDALSLVIGNLLGNAIKYTPASGRITVGVSRQSSGGLARFYCRDTGIGISPEDQAKIFSGYRTQSGREAAKGFGVGLALASGIIEAHESRLEVESEPGKGSCFSFLLPVAAG